MTSCIYNIHFLLFETFKFDSSRFQDSFDTKLSAQVLTTRWELLPEAAQVFPFGQLQGHRPGATLLGCFPSIIPGTCPGGGAVAWTS